MRFQLFLFIYRFENSLTNKFKKNQMGWGGELADQRDAFSHFNWARTSIFKFLGCVALPIDARPTLGGTLSSASTPYRNRLFYLYRNSKSTSPKPTSESQESISPLGFESAELGLRSFKVKDSEMVSSTTNLIQTRSISSCKVRKHGVKLQFVQSRYQNGFAELQQQIIHWCITPSA